MINLVVLAIDNNKTPSGNSRLWSDTKRFQYILEQIKITCSVLRIKQIHILHNCLTEKFQKYHSHINYIYNDNKAIFQTITNNIDNNALITSSYFLYNKYSVAQINPRKSSLVLLDKKGQRDDIYTVIDKKDIKSLAYSLAFEKEKVLPFGQISYYSSENYTVLSKLVSNAKYCNLEEFELINKIIELGGRFEAIYNKHIDIKSLKYVKKTNSIYNK